MYREFETPAPIILDVANRKIEPCVPKDRGDLLDISCELGLQNRLNLFEGSDVIKGLSLYDFSLWICVEGRSLVAEGDLRRIALRAHQIFL